MITSKKMRSQKGFTLTEIAIVLGIMGLILGAIWTAASAVYSNRRSEEAQTAVIQAVQSLRVLYSTQAQFEAPGDMNEELSKAGAIPKNLVLYKNTGEFDGTSGPFPNGKFNVTATDTTTFAITMSLVPRENCINIIPIIAGNSRDPGLLEVVATASNSPAISSVVCNEPHPMTAPVSVTQATNNHCTADMNQVTFCFSLK